MKKIATTLLLILSLILVACDVDSKLDELQKDETVTSASNRVNESPTLPKIVAWTTLTSQAKGGNRLLSGVVSAAETTNLAFESSGKVNAVNVKLGDHFLKGQRLATLDKTNYTLQLRQAKATYSSAVANRDQARKEVKRFERLVKAKAASAIQLDNYRLQYKTAQESINNAQVQIELAQKQLKDTELIAPFNGAVTAQLAEVGQLASPQVPIFTVEAEAKTEVSLSVPENLIANIQRDQQVRVSLPAQPNTGRLIATVTEIGNQANFGAFTVKLVLQHSPPNVKPGMTAEVVLPMENVNADGYDIPPSALGAGANNSYFVYRIVEKTGIGDRQFVLESVPITVETLSEHTVTIHGDSLRSGNKIVRSGWSFLKSGQRIRLMGSRPVIVNP